MENNFDITKFTSFKTGGQIKKFFSPETVDEFINILQKESAARVIGNLSNVLVSSDGYEGVVITTNKMCKVEINDDFVSAECGVKGAKLAQMVAEKGLSGFEFMIGFPGSIGGNIFMNASANGQCISDNLVSVKCFCDNEIKTLFKDELDFSYRHSLFQDKFMTILSADFQLQKGEKEIIISKMHDNLKFRKEHQPLLNLPNCGSIFKNPENGSAGRLLDLVGAKQMSVGGAKVWENHANFIVNYNNATSFDILSLMNKMADAVYKEYNIKLIPEIRFLGGNNEEEDILCKKLQIKSV